MDDAQLMRLVRQAVAPWRTDRARERSGNHAPGSHADTRARDAAEDAARILADGMWHSATELGGIAKRHRASLPGMYQVLDGFGLAQSDSGRYLCIPTDWTPESAPDGT